MKVLIAGASGALGIPLVRALIASNHQVIGLTRTPGNARELSALGAQPVVADAMDRDGLLRAVDGLYADAVVHALTALKKTPLHHRDMYQTNALREVGTANLLAAARAVGARTFVAESMTMGYGYGNWGEQVLTEECPFAPPGRSQELERHLAGFRALERQIFEATEAGWIEGISLRFGAFYGPTSIQPIIQMMRRRSLPLPDGGRAVMSWIYIEDAAAAIVAALERGKPGQAYNIVDDEPVRVRDFFALLARQSHTPMPFSLPAWVMRLAAPYGTDFLATTMRVSNARAVRELGWQPVAAPTYREGIQRAIQELGLH
jgi:nucleoside-diphosphate-sugar epimerase